MCPSENFAVPKTYECMTHGGDGTSAENPVHVQPGAGRFVQVGRPIVEPDLLTVIQTSDENGHALLKLVI